jgi:hypothetical protein
LRQNSSAVSAAGWRLPANQLFRVENSLSPNSPPKNHGPAANISAVGVSKRHGFLKFTTPGSQYEISGLGGIRVRQPSKGRTPNQQRLDDGAAEY